MPEKKRGRPPKAGRSGTAMVRVSRETLAALHAEAVALADAYERGTPIVAEYDPDGRAPQQIGVTLDAVIAYLLAFRSRHRQRVAKARQRRAQANRTG